jgi:hypothetical protein
MPDNIQNQAQNTIQPPAPKQKNKREIMDADPDTLTTAELERRALFTDIDYKDFQRELVKRQTEQLRMKDAENRDKFWSRGRELKNTAAAQKKQQDGCSHLKGGKGIQALISGGTDMSDAALIRHLFPWGEWKARCQRCGKTFAAPRPEDFDLSVPEEKTAFDKQKADFDWAMKAPSNNSASTGITFQHHSDDDDKSAKKFVRETISNVNLR